MTWLKNLRIWFGFGWLWLLGISIFLLPIFHQTVTTAQSEAVNCFEGNASIPIAPSLVYTLTEGGPSTTYSLKLCTEPSDQVTVTLELSDGARQQLEIQSAEQFFFDATSWEIPQSVTIRAKDDKVIEPALQTVSIGHVAASKDPDYNYPQINKPNVVVVVRDNDLGAYLPFARLDPTSTPTVTPTPTSTPKPTLTPTLTATPTPQWKQFATTPQQVDVVAIGDTHLFAGVSVNDASKGIYRANTCNENLTSIQGGIRVQDLTFLGQYGLAATYGNRVYYSRDAGGSWHPTDSSINPYHYAVVFINSNLAYTGADDGIYVSNNQGQTWGKVTPDNGVGPTLINAFRYVEATGQLWIGAYGNGVWTLTPGGNHFVDRSAGLNNSEGERRVWDIFPRSASELYLATSNGVYKGDGNTAWTAFGQAGELVFTLAGVGDELYAGLNNKGVFHTEFGNPFGWTQSSRISTNTTVQDLLFDTSGVCPEWPTQQNALFAGAANGIWAYR